MFCCCFSGLAYKIRASQDYAGRKSIRLLEGLISHTCLSYNEANMQLTLVGGMVLLLRELVFHPKELLESGDFLSCKCVVNLTHFI